MRTGPPTVHSWKPFHSALSTPASPVLPAQLESKPRLASGCPPREGKSKLLSGSLRDNGMDRRPIAEPESVRASVTLPKHAPSPRRRVVHTLRTTGFENFLNRCHRTGLAGARGAMVPRAHRERQRPARPFSTSREVLAGAGAAPLAWLRRPFGVTRLPARGIWRRRVRRRLARDRFPVP